MSGSSLNSQAPLLVSRCRDQKIDATIPGTYVHDGAWNHGKPVYRKENGSLPVSLYYWDARDGPAFSGWWFGSEVGADLVWGHHPAASKPEELQPPTSQWQIPHDGEVDPDFAVTPSAASSSPPTFSNVAATVISSSSSVEARAKIKIANQKKKRMRLFKVDDDEYEDYSPATFQRRRARASAERESRLELRRQHEAERRAIWDSIRKAPVPREKRKKRRKVTAATPAFDPAANLVAVSPAEIAIAATTTAPAAAAAAAVPAATAAAEVLASPTVAAVAASVAGGVAVASPSASPAAVAAEVDTSTSLLIDSEASAYHAETSQPVTAASPRLEVRKRRRKRHRDAGKAAVPQLNNSAAATTTPTTTATPTAAAAATTTATAAAATIIAAEAAACPPPVAPLKVVKELEAQWEPPSREAPVKTPVRQDMQPQVSEPTPSQVEEAQPPAKRGRRRRRDKAPKSDLDPQQETALVSVLCALEELNEVTVDNFQEKERACRHVLDVHLHLLGSQSEATIDRVEKSIAAAKKRVFGPEIGQEEEAPASPAAPDPDPEPEPPAPPTPVAYLPPPEPLPAAAGNTDVGPEAPSPPAPPTSTDASVNSTSKEETSASATSSASPIDLAAQRELERRQKEEKMRRKEEALQRKREEKRRQEEETLKKLEDEKYEARRRERELHKQEEARLQAQQEEERRQQEAARMLIVESAQKLATATLENFESMRNSLLSLMEAQLDSTGPNKELLKAECLQIINQTALGLEKAREAALQVASKATELKNLISTAEVQGQRTLELAESLSDQTLGEPELARRAQDVEKELQAASKSLQQAAPLVKLPDLAGEVPGVASRMTAVAAAITKSSGLLKQFKAKPKVPPPKDPLQDRFASYDLDKDGFLNCQEAFNLAKAELQLDPRYELQVFKVAFDALPRKPPGLSPEDLKNFRAMVAKLPPPAAPRREPAASSARMALKSQVMELFKLLEASAGTVAAGVKAASDFKQHAMSMANASSLKTFAEQALAQVSAAEEAVSRLKQPLHRLRWDARMETQATQDEVLPDVKRLSESLDGQQSQLMEARKSVMLERQQVAARWHNRFDKLRSIVVPRLRSCLDASNCGWLELWEELAQGGLTVNSSRVAAHLRENGAPSMEDHIVSQLFAACANFGMCLDTFPDDQISHITKDEFASLIRSYWKVDSPTELRGDADISKSVRTLEPGELVEVFHGPVDDEARSGDQWLFVKAIKDNTSGWVRSSTNVGSNGSKQAKKLLLPGAETLYVTSSCAFQPDFDEEAKGIKKQSRTLFKGELVDVLDWQIRRVTVLLPPNTGAADVGSSNNSSSNSNNNNNNSNSNSNGSTIEGGALQAKEKCLLHCRARSDGMSGWLDLVGVDGKPLFVAR